MRVGRYHSLAIDEASAPESLVVTARVSTRDTNTAGTGLIMGVKHRELPIYGVQFHPESVLSEDGADVLANFVRIAAQWHLEHQANANRRVAS